MFSTDAGICECNRYPIYSHQLPNNAPPHEHPLPPEFQQLCLACIHSVYSKFIDDSYADRWVAAGILNPIFTDSMLATSLTCYEDYYEQRDYKPVYIEYNKACEWTLLRVTRAKAELSMTGEERKDEVVHRVE